MKNNISITIPSTQAFTYPIFLEKGLLCKPESWIPLFTRKIVIITDDNVKKLYGEGLQIKLQALKYNTILLDFPAGEASKQIKTKCSLEEKMFEFQCDRNALILALGGGVVGDLAGYIAATYMRGIAYIQIPTTLLAMVDSSIGGKTGINTEAGKNLIGAFWHPQKVIIDKEVLKTLPENHVFNGLFEAIKIFLTCEPDNLKWVYARDFDNIIRLALQLKAQIIMEDEKEKNKRAILNFGHTIGHALESFSDYSLLHGYAVAYGMLVESKIACLMGILSEKDFKTVLHVLQDFDIYGEKLKNYDVDQVISYIQIDKKKKGDDLRFVLLEKLGKVWVNQEGWTHVVSEHLIREAWVDLTVVDIKNLVNSPI